MNYLAHAYLSFNDPELLVGNLISDFVKGKTKYSYPLRIQKGIHLHRAIDAFTDKHHATHQAKEFFQPYYGRYSAVFTDVVYDHFLASDPGEFNQQSLQSFSKKTYEILDRYEKIFPARFRFIFPYMKEFDWLSNYRHRWGIERSFGGIVRRARYIDDSDSACTVLDKHYEELKECYNNFFPSLKTFSRSLSDALLAEEGHQSNFFAAQ